MKILAVDRTGIHVRLYVERFRNRPTQSEIPELTLAPFGPEYAFSIGHIPLCYASFAAWNPRFICTRSVDENELDGYRMWVDAPGGYF